MHSDLRIEDGGRIKNQGKTPNLIDVDGDIWHTIPNTAKMFAKPFDYYTETLFTDIHLDVLATKTAQLTLKKHLNKIVFPFLYQRKLVLQKFVEKRRAKHHIY